MPCLEYMPAYHSNSRSSSFLNHVRSSSRGQWRKSRFRRGSAWSIGLSVPVADIDLCIDFSWLSRLSFRGNPRKLRGQRGSEQKKSLVFSCMLRRCRLRSENRRNVFPQVSIIHRWPWVLDETWSTVGKAVAGSKIRFGCELPCSAGKNISSGVQLEVSFEPSSGVNVKL